MRRRLREIRKERGQRRASTFPRFMGPK